MANVVGTNFNFEYPGDISTEFLYAPSVLAPEFTSLFNVIQNVKNKKRLLAVSSLTKFVRAQDGCDMPETGEVEMSDRTLQLCNLYFHVSQCQDAFDGTIIEEGMPTGLDKFELGAEVLNVVSTVLNSGLTRDLFRIFSFSDSGDADDDWNQCDGLVTKLIEGIAAYEVLRPDNITALNQTAGTRALDYLRNAATECSNTLKSMPANMKVIYVTGNIYENLLETFENADLTANGGDRSLLTRVADVLYFRGIEVRYFYAWDEALLDVTNPYYGQFNTMLIYTAKENHVVGVGKVADQGAIRQYFWEADNKVHWKGAPNMGYNFIFGDLTVFSYGQVS